MPKKDHQKKHPTTPVSMDQLERAALGLADESPQRLTPHDLKKRISQRLSVPRATALQVMTGLIVRGLLTYSYEFGCSFVEIGYQRPVRLSRHILVTPPGVRCFPANQDVVIEMMAGASFGSGQHTTTRLALRGIEYILKQPRSFQQSRPTSCLDIGTGSGILAIAALKLGIDQALGLDIDPCARAESKANARHNGLENRLAVGNAALEALHVRYDLILANLRLPTLCRMSQQLPGVVKKDSVLVLSGFRETEAADLQECYGEAGFHLCWEASEKRWSAAAYAEG
jgi:ribosomal protein L11 methyltransferase